MKHTEYSEEYIHFIKTFIANQCYIQYCVLSVQEDQAEDTIWKKIMEELNIPIQYLVSLYKKIDYELPLHGVQIFQQKTFQEYIDSIVNLKYDDYKQFIKSMNDENFKNNMVEKYKNEMYKNSVKNYLIYVIQLYLSKYNYNRTIFTEEECNEMDISLNIIPYLEYIESLRHKPSEHKNTMEEEHAEFLENETILYINEKLSIQR